MILPPKTHPAKAQSLPPNSTDQQVKDYYRQLNKDFALNNLVAGLKVDFSAYIKNPSLLSEQRQYLATDGRLWPETVVTTMEVVEKLLKGRNVGLLGLVQSAKTATQIVAGIIAAIAKYLTDGRWTHPIHLIPNHKGSYRSQFKKKYNELIRCIRDAVISYNGKSISIGQYMEDLLIKRNEIMAKARTDAKSTFNRSQWNTLVEMSAKIAGDKELILPMSVKIRDVLQVMFKGFKENNHRSILIRDEAHSAIAKKSVTDRLMSDDRLSESSIYDIINRCNGDALFMATSATNWAALHLDLVCLRVNDAYCGLDFAYEDDNGQIVRVAWRHGVEIKTPEILSLSQMAARLGYEPLKWIRPHWYAYQDAFFQHMEEEGLQNLFSGHQDYRRKCIVGISKMVNSLLIEDNVKGHRGALVRFVNDNDLMNDAVAMLKEYLDSRIKIVKEYGDSHETIDDLLAENKIGPKDIYVVLATAGARMSDSFPKECGYGIDLTYNSETLTAIIQGVLGRMCGYFKTPLVVLSDENVKTIQKKYIDNGFMPKGGQKLLSEAKQGKQSSYRYFPFADNKEDAVFEKIKGRLQGVINIYGKPMVKNGQKQVNLGREVAIDFFNCVTDQDLDHIQQKYDIRLLGKYETDEQKRTHFIVDDRVVMTVRAEGTDRHKHRGGRPGDKLADGTHRLRPIIRVKFVGRNRKPVVVGFDLVVFQTRNDKISSLDTIFDNIENID